MSFTNSDAMGHNCLTISHLAYSQSLKHLTPELCMCFSNFCCEIAFVSESVMLSSHASFSIFQSPRCMISRIRWKRQRTCLDRWWDCGSLAYAIAPLLSQYNRTGSAANGTTPNPIRNLRIQTASFTAPLFKQNMYPDCNLESSLSVWKLALVYPVTSSSPYL